MTLSDYGSWASIIALLLAVFAGYKLIKHFKNSTKQENKLFSFFNSGSISQKNSHDQKDD